MSFEKPNLTGLRTGASTTALALLLLATPGMSWAQSADQASEEEAPAESEIVVTGQLLDTGASSATKLDLPVLDTPFSVASYNNNFLKAIETSSVSDLYRYMTGIQRAGNTGYDITFRGFKTSGNDRNAILTDGLPGLSVRFGSPPTVGVDHIELVKGPTSVLYGQAQPGGFINIITKKPSERSGFEITLKGNHGAGTFDRAQGGLIQLDFTGPVTEDGALSARFVGEGGYNQGFRDFSYEKPIYAAPSLTWRVGPDTSLTVQGEYRWIKTHVDTYLVAPNRDATRVAAINTTYQEEGDYLVERGTIGNVYLSHSFSPDLKLNLGYRYVDHIDTQRNFDVVGFRDTANTIITRRARGQENKRTYSFGDANLTAKFDTFGFAHTLLVGVAGGRETASLNRLQFYNCTGSGATGCNRLDIALNNPVHGTYPGPQTFPLFNPGQASNLNWRYTTQESLGVYGSDFIEFSDMFKAMFGLRYSKERQTLADLRLTTFVPSTKKDSKVLPFGGLLFQPMRNVSFYTSYSTSFVPVPAAQQDVFGLNPFTPTKASSIEGGIKAELFDRRLNLTAAYFDIKKKDTINTFSCPLTLAALNAFITANNITVPANAPRDAAGNLIPGSGTCSNQLGGERSKGFEIEGSASPLPNWQITAGYSHIDARVTASNVPGQTGARLTNAPGDAFNLWTRYDVEEGGLKGLGLGFGVSYIGKRAGLLPTAAVDARPKGGTLPLDAYTTVDLAMYYQASENINVTLKATNLLDERYIESAGFTGDIQLVPGAPRLLTLTVRAKY
ncbi:iron complex outermembrane receptor protein [Novosphingobium kunmingense]|uniref:Iron complex outermembrane receptor protein n=1 Tax=Novosphingobium kunmingense TaxID=1211806 RepID=A0A2N0H3D3_9SPHN|nr:TonB-dependent receptor [Novosphingobium kunmingense]PKB13456.1 iron complex outermembrane receptor protein [Novosphingobium kunmingense]